jgi:hypothetical protein
MLCVGHRADKPAVFWSNSGNNEARGGNRRGWRRILDERFPLRAQSTSFSVDWTAAGTRGGARVGRPRHSRIFRVFSGG